MTHPDHDAARAVLRNLLAEADRNTCLHETTHRGGAIWTICDDCGRKWADDQGGFEPYCDSPAVAAARAFLADPSPASRPEGAGRDEKLDWFLTVLASCGGQTCANAEPWNWINAFCDDRGTSVDTFNLAHDLGLTWVSHDSDTDGGNVGLTKAGRSFLSDLERATHPKGAAPAVAGVTDKIVDRALDVWFDHEWRRHHKDTVADFRRDMRKVLEAVWPTNLPPGPAQGSEGGER